MKKQENKLIEKHNKENVMEDEIWEKDPEEPLKIPAEDLLDAITGEEEGPVPPYETPEPGEGP